MPPTIPHSFVVYDQEVLPNIFTLGSIRPATGETFLFEISHRRNDIHALIEWITMLQSTGATMVGFNSLNFDYPILHKLLNQHHVMDNVCMQLHVMAQEIIQSDDLWTHTIWDRDMHVPQLDLMLVHHFNNNARRTSLKALEFSLRLANIQEFNFGNVNIPLAPGRFDSLIDYQWNDIDATAAFLEESMDAIELRQQLSADYGRNFMNSNDTKIGKSIFIMKLEEASPGVCYDENRNARQTHRSAIAIKDIIFPYVSFKQPEFNRVKRHFESLTVARVDKEIFKGITAQIDGFTFDFGAGGIHGSINNAIVVEDPERAVIDLDVTSYYPSLAISNRLYPEHLGEQFVDIYAEIKSQRAQHPKGSAQNKALKLALNGVYGDSGNPYSPFFDIQYLLSITINGQLLLCMLAENLMEISGLELIQINTDGLTIRIPRDQIDHMTQVMSMWETITGLDLERVDYCRMFIRDVNNYIAETLDGKLKRKGAYEHAPPGERNPSGWHQNLSAQVVPKAAEAFLVRNVPIESFIHGHQDIMDFMLRVKVNRSSHLVLDDETPLQSLTRYLVTRSGHTLTKVSPPPDGYQVGQWKRANGIPDSFYHQVRGELTEAMEMYDPPDVRDTTGLPWDERINTKNKSKYDERRTTVESGWLVTPYNQIYGPIDRSTINFDYYIQAAQKLVDELRIML